MRAHLLWALHRIGYVIRPYDMLADARRWFWQPRTACGWSGFHTLAHAESDRWTGGDRKDAP